MAVRIGFDDEEEVDLSKLSTKKQGEIIKEAKKKTVYLSERRAKEFLESGYDCVVVNTFYNDDYHLSDEEKEANNAFYKEFVKYNKMKNTYRKLDEYVVKVRELLKCLDLVAENNNIYDAEKFKKLYLRGKIEIVGLKWPRFKGKERKEISYDYLTEFILSDRDPKEILPSYKEDLEDEVDDDNIFTEEELEMILKPLTEEEARLENTFYDEDDDTSGTNMVKVLSNKDRKKLRGQELTYVLKDFKRRQRDVDVLSSSYLHQLTYEDIDKIAEYDQKYNFKSKDDIPDFKGDISNSSDFNKYMNKLDKFEKTHTKVNIGGKMKTLAEVEEIELKQLLEDNGWDIRNFAINKEKEDKLKKIKKLNKKKEQKLKEKLLELKNRKKRKLNDDLDDEIRKYSKKKKKHKDKDLKKKHKKDRDKIKEKVSKGYEKALLRSSNRKEESFDEWEENVTDFTSGFMKG